MTNYKLVTAILLIIIVGLLTAIFQLIGWFDILASFPDIWIWIAAILLGIASNLITGEVIKKRKDSKEIDKENTLDPKFSHLLICFSQRTESPYSTSQSRPRYIINNNTNEAYWVSTYVDINIKGKTNWHSFDGAIALNNYLHNNNIHLNNRDPNLDELGLE